MFSWRIGNAVINIRLDESCQGDEGQSALDRALEAVAQIGGEIVSQIDELKTAVIAQTEAIGRAKQEITDDVNRLQEELSEALAEKPELNELLERIKSNTQEISTLDPVVDPLPEGGEVVVPTPDETPSAPSGGESPEGETANEPETGTSSPEATGSDEA